MDDIKNIEIGQDGFEIVYEESFQQQMLPNFLDDDNELINSLLNDLPEIELIGESSSSSSSLSIATSIEEFALSNIPQNNNSIPSSKFDEPKNGKSKTLCPICKDGDAGHHKHYGGSACISCRAFFRRAVHNNAYKNFRCPIINKNYVKLGKIPVCDINSKSWNSCRFCRFEKCLASGLRISLVLTQHSKKMTPTKHQAKHPCGYIKTDREPQELVNANVLSTASFTKIEVSVITARTGQFQFDHLMKETVRYFATNPTGFDTLLKLYFKTYVHSEMMDIGNAKRFGNWWQNTFKNFLINTYEDYKSLGPDILSSLDNHNMASVYFINSVASIGNAIIISPVKEMLESIQQRQRYLRSQFLLDSSTTAYQNNSTSLGEINPNDDYEDCLTTLAIRAINQNIETSQPKRPIDYDQAYPAKMWTDETIKWEGIIRKNLHDVAIWPTFNITNPKVIDGGGKKINKPRTKLNRHKGLTTQKAVTTTRLNSTEVKIDYVLLHLLSMVALYSLDGITAMDKSKKVEQLQHRYLHLLHQYLTFRFPKDAYLRLARGMNAISKARESCEILRIFS